MTPTQITKLIEHYGLPEGLEYDHDDDDFYSLPCSQTQHPLPHHFGLILLASHITLAMRDRENRWSQISLDVPDRNSVLIQSEGGFKKQYSTSSPPHILTLTAALEIIE